MIIILPLLFLLSLGTLLFQTGVFSSLMILCAFILSVLGALSLIKRKQYLSFLFVSIYLVMYFANPFLVSLGVFPLESSMPVNLFARTNALLIFGLLLFFLGTRISKIRRSFSAECRIYLNRSSITYVLIWLFIIAGGAFFLAIAFGGGWSALQATRAELAAGQYTAKGLVRLVSIYMFFPFLVGAPLLITQLSKPLQPGFWIITFLILVGNFFLFRARTPFVTVLASIAIGVLLKNRVVFVYGQATSVWLRSFRDYLSVFIIGAIILIGGVVSTFLRGYVSEGRIKLSSGYAKIWIEQTFDGGDLGYQKIQRAAYSSFPGLHPYLMGQSYYRIFFIPFPRFIVPNKPENTSRVFCSVLNPTMYMTGGTIPPGILGDLHINFSYFGILGMFIYGLIFGRERQYRLWHWLMLGGSMTWLVHFVRGEFTNSLVTLGFYVILTMIIEKFLHPDYVNDSESINKDSSESEFEYQSK
jgi:oligosaccharide repeat unit polymerase